MVGPGRPTESKSPCFSGVPDQFVRFHLKIFVALFLLVGSGVPGVAEVAPPSELPRPAKLLPLATQAVFLDIVVNKGSVFAVGERGTIIRSEDHGQTWRQLPTPVDVTLTAISFADPETGWVVGHESTILKTQDGGETWRVVRYKPEEERYYLNVRFENSREGVVLGTDGELWSTSDGGETWSLQVLSVESWYQNHLFAFQQFEDGRAVIAAERGGVFGRRAGHDKWRVVESPYTGTFFGVTELADHFLLYGMSGKAYLLDLAGSDDGADRWQEIPNASDQFLLAASTESKGERVLLVGRGGVVLEIGTDGRVKRHRQRPDRIDITAIAQDSEFVYLASMKGGVDRLPATELFLQ